MTYRVVGAGVPGEQRLPSMVASSAPGPGSLERYDVLALDYELARVRDAVRAATGDMDRTEVPWRHESIDSTVIWELFVTRIWGLGNCETRTPGA